MKYLGFPKTDPEGPGVINGANPLCIHNMVALLGGGKKGGGMGPSWQKKVTTCPVLSLASSISPLSLLPISQEAKNSLHHTPCYHHLQLRHMKPSNHELDILKL